jgi:hypothetical protein
VTLTAGLFPVSSVTGSAGAISATMGAVTAGSTVAFASPSASTVNHGNSGDFTIPANGHYTLGLTLSGNPAVNSHISIAMQLQQRWT